MCKTFFFLSNLEGRGDLKVLGEGGRIILNWILQKCGVRDSIVG